MSTIYTVTLNPAFDVHYQMPSFEARKENYVTQATVQAGGKGINVSRVLTNSGVPITAYVVLGRENASAFEAELSRDGVSYVPFYTDGRIRENMTLHPQNDKETRISLDTFSMQPSVLEELEAVLATAKEGILVFAGRLPRGISKAAALAFLTRCKARGMRVVIDSNSFTAEDLRAVSPWFIKPNEQEVAVFAGETPKTLSEAAAIARRMVQDGVSQNVLITLGGDGAAWSDGTRAFGFSVPKIEHPVSTIGAGDSTVAGLLVAHEKGLTDANALCLALSYGTAACLTEGTLPPNTEDVNRICAQIETITFG